MNAAHYLEQYRSLAAALPGQGLPWLDAMRDEAQARFSANGFPSPREEEWKYTNVSPIEKKLFKPLAAPAPDAIDRNWLDSYRLADAWSMVLVDGHFCRGLSNLEGVPDGVVAAGMGETLQAHPELVKKVLGTVSIQESHGFMAFNTAFFTDGTFVLVPPGVTLDKALQLIHVSTRPDGLSNTRSCIALGEQAAASVVETYVGSADLGYLSAAVTEVKIGAHATLDFYKVQSESDRAYHFGGIYVAQERSARFRQYNLAFGALLVRNEIHTELHQGAECEMNGLFLAARRQHVDNHTLIQHLEPHGSSRENYRGVLSDRARGVFQGRIVVHPKAQKTDAAMNNRNLLLSEDAEIDTKPQLEILADDVKCAHGVTVGQLDPQSVFYLESRGIDRLSARNMLTFAFANEMVESIELEGLRALARGQLLRLFPQTGIRRDWL
jgi:Fe-S cluster assembly protein SufD